MCRSVWGHVFPVNVAMSLLLLYFGYICSVDSPAHDGTVNSLRFTPDGLRLLTYGKDGALRLWAVGYGNGLLMECNIVSNMARKAVRMDMSDVVYSSQLAFVPSDTDVAVVNTLTGSLVNTLSGHYHTVNCCVTHPSNHYVFSGGSDRNILAWIPSNEMQGYEDHAKMLRRRREDTENSGAKAKNDDPPLPSVDEWSSSEEDV